MQIEFLLLAFSGFYKTTMRLLSVKMYLALLWGISALLSKDSMSASIPVTSNINSSPEPNKINEELITAHVQNETETHAETWHPTSTPAEVGVSVAGAESAATVETEEALSTYSSDSSNSSTAGLVSMTTVAATASSSGPGQLQTLTSVTAGGDDAQASLNMTISVSAKPQESATTSADLTSASATTSAAPFTTGSSPQPTPTTRPQVPSPHPVVSTQTPVFTQSPSSPSASTTTSTMRGNATSEAAPVFGPTSTDTSTNNTEPSSTSRPVFETTAPLSTSQWTEKGGLPSSTEPTSFSSASTTTADVSTRPSKSPASTEAHPCSSQSLAMRCLIAIVSLAGLLTIFMVSTIVLCTKLSARNHKVRKKKRQQDTEMMCISSLLHESTYTTQRQRHPVPNGVLVFPGFLDSDGEDNITLSSFLPENDRFV